MRILHTHFVDPDCRLRFCQGLQRLARIDTVMLWGFPFSALAAEHLFERLLWNSNKHCILSVIDYSCTTSHP